MASSLLMGPSSIAGSGLTVQWIASSVQPLASEECSFLVATDLGSYFADQTTNQLNATYGINANYSIFDGAGVSPSIEPTQKLTCMEKSTFNTYPEPLEHNVAEKQLRCKYPDCPEGREFFTESALRKHEDKHKKPYICSVPACNHRRFGDKGGLERHKREVHGPKTYRCPITSCKGHTKGFARKYNLFEHQKRCHPGQLSHAAVAVIRTSDSQINTASEGMEETRDGDEDASSPEMMVMADSGASDGGGLRGKLKELYRMRAELDRDIEILEKAAGIPGDKSP
ncbi:uncharacterized protein PAC_19422 [Phialocephala subalpina]|uniref:C2H2-type domain-containing protein n=1 Tax=Phialocephala subalpina TaxID=576137 RepID=A0A1L7XWT2_9HELO|nr:uncharacterized protein PAC_19422 [Phialocephala subalpina]